MNSQDSLDRLRTLVLLCQQLPVEESESLMLGAVNDPHHYTNAVAALCRSGRIQLPADLVDLLQRDLHALPVAV